MFLWCTFTFAALVRSSTGRYAFTGVCLLTGGTGAGNPVTGPAEGGLALSLGREPPPPPTGHGRGTPLPRARRTSAVMPRAVSLLRSGRRTFLFSHILNVASDVFAVCKTVDQ